MSDWYKVEQSDFTSGFIFKDQDEIVGHMFFVENEYDFRGFLYESLEGRLIKVYGIDDLGKPHEILVNKTLIFRLRDQLEVKVVEKNTQ